MTPRLLERLLGGLAEVASGDPIHEITLRGHGLTFGFLEASGCETDTLAAVEVEAGAPVHEAEAKRGTAAEAAWAADSWFASRLPALAPDDRTQLARAFVRAVASTGDVCWMPLGAGGLLLAGAHVAGWMRAGDRA